MKFVEKIKSFLWKKKPPVVPPAEPVIVVPILERFALRPCPEYSRLNEDLYCQGMTAEDGSLWLFLDYARAGNPLVEVRIDDFIYDLRNDPLGPGDWTWSHSQMANNRMRHWLIRHGRDLELNDPSYGYHVRNLCY